MMAEQQHTIMEKYIKLLESREAEALKLTQERETWLEEKEYNTQLRLAIGNIPVNEKKSDPTNRAIRKAKKLASTAPSKKRNRDATDTTPKPKRKYVRRKLTASDQAEQKKVSVAAATIPSGTTSSSSTEGEDDEDEESTTSSDEAFISFTEGELGDDTLLSIHKAVDKMKTTSPSLSKPKLSHSLVISDSFL